jgi:hypothetical protein
MQLRDWSRAAVCAALCLWGSLKAGILDEKFYAFWMRTTLIRDWDQAKEFIEICRERPNRRNPAAFEHFERMAERFRQDASLAPAAFRSPIHRFFENHIWPSRT